MVVKAGENQSELYDKPRNRYGIPSSGYFVALAQSPNLAGREDAEGIGRWADKPRGFDKDTSRWEYREMLEQHQESVWKHRTWPDRL